MRLIDADALKDVFNEQPPEYYTTAYVTGLIDRMPTVGSWISIKDRLPKKYGFYLCLTMSDDIKLHYQINLWGNKHWFWGHHGVHYWMPLPEKPEVVRDV